MQFILWIIFGGVVGLIAHIADTQKADGGVVTSVGIGILGALFGGFVAHMLFGDTLFLLDVSSITLALSLTILSLLVYRTVFSLPHSHI
jgi:uncharacterized membrane protein YeaQ/YmgE (transglycosylase-associated protein family)